MIDVYVNARVWFKRIWMQACDSREYKCKGVIHAYMNARVWSSQYGGIYDFDREQLKSPGDKIYDIDENKVTRAAWGAK
jgi:hypothetical protein